MNTAVIAQNVNSLDLFINGTNGALWYAYWTGTTWTAPTFLSGNVTSGPAATSRGSLVRGRLCARQGQRPLEKTYNGLWSGWMSADGI